MGGDKVEGGRGIYHIIMLGPMHSVTVTAGLSSNLSPPVSQIWGR